MSVKNNFDKMREGLEAEIKAKKERNNELKNLSSLYDMFTAIAMQNHGDGKSYWVLHSMMGGGDIELYEDETKLLKEIIEDRMKGETR